MLSCVSAARKGEWPTLGSQQLLQMALLHFGRVLQERGCYYRNYGINHVKPVFQVYSQTC